MTDKFLMSYCITQFYHNVVARIIRLSTTNVTLIGALSCD